MACSNLVERTANVAHQLSDTCFVLQQGAEFQAASAHDMTDVLQVCASGLPISPQHGMVRSASDHAEAASYPFRPRRPPEGKYASRPMHGGEEQSGYENKVIYEEAEFSLVAGPTARTME